MTVLESNNGSGSVSQKTIIGNGEQQHVQNTLRASVEVAVADYFNQLEGQKVVELYELVISEVEAPLLEAVMSYTNGNQTKASIAMGLNRGTLRKKLKKYGML